MNSSQTYIAVPPGASIKEQLVLRNMNQKEFAVRMGMSEKHISKLINGEVLLTSETAVKLEMVLGVPARFWNNLESSYRETLIKVELENSMGADIELARRFPYSDMARYGWLPETKNIVEKVINLRKFFEVIDLSLIESKQITRIACSKLSVTDKSDIALMAFAQEAKIRARDIKTAPIDIRRLDESIGDIRSLSILNSKKAVSRLQTCLADYGIAIVFLPVIKGVRSHGVSFIDGNKIVIGIIASEQFDDQFWSSVFHEIAHIILGHLNMPQEISSKDEKNAHRLSCDYLISNVDIKSFIAEHDYSKDSILKYAHRLSVAPGIVVGRMQDEGIIKRSDMNDLKTRFEAAG